MKNILSKFQKGYPRASEITRFLMVGGLATAVDMLVMAIVMFLPNHSLYGNDILTFFLNSGITPTKWVVIGTIIGFLTGLVINYVLSYKFVYVGENKKARTKKGFILFLVLSAIGLVIQSIGMFVGYDLLKLNEWFIKIVLVCVVIVFNYITRKLFIFNDNKPVVAVPVEFTKHEKKMLERVAFLLMFLIYFFVAYVFLYYLVSPKQGYIFNADHFRVFSDWNIFEENHYRTKVHPLYVLFIYPIFSTMKFLGADAYFACVLFCAVVSTLNTILVYKIIGKLTGKPYSLVTILTSLMFAFAFAVFDNTLKTESFAIGCLTLLIFWYWFVCNYNKELAWKDYLVIIGLGVLAISMTLTNYVQFCIGLCFLFVFKKFKSVSEFFKSLGIMCSIVVMSLVVSWFLILIQILIFKTAEDAIAYAIQIFFDLISGTNSSEEFMYMGENSVTKSLCNIFIFYFGYAFLGGNILAPGNYLHMEPTIFTYMIAICNLILFVYGIFKVIKNKKHIYLPFIVSFVFECALHCVYGSATIMLYLLHGIFAIPIVMSIAVDLEHKIDKYLCLIFTGTLVINIIQTIFNIFTIFKYIHRDYGRTGRILALNIQLFIFIPLAIAVIYLAFKYFKNYTSKNKPIEIKKEKPNWWVGVVALIMVAMLISLSIFEIIQIRRQWEIDNAPPTLILMGIGQRNKYFVQQLGDGSWELCSYDVEEEKSEVVLNNFKVNRFNVENAYVLECEDENKKVFYVRETEDSLHFEMGGQITTLDDRDVKIPEFENYTNKKYMKYLFYETMVNCLNGGFCLNYLYAPEICSDIDGLMGMVLEKTRNQKELIYNFDVNNIKSYGQTLYLISLNGNANQNLVNSILEKAEEETTDGLVCDSVYETVWLRYVLDKMNIEADWCVVPEEHSVEKEYCWFYEPSKSENYDANIGNVQLRLFVFEKNWYPQADIVKLHYYGKKAVIPEKLKYPISFEYKSDLAEEFGNKLSLSSRMAGELLLYFMDYDTFAA